MLDDSIKLLKLLVNLIVITRVVLIFTFIVRKNNLARSSKRLQYVYANTYIIYTSNSRLNYLKQ